MVIRVGVVGSGPFFGPERGQVGFEPLRDVMVGRGRRRLGVGSGHVVPRSTRSNWRTACRPAALADVLKELAERRVAEERERFVGGRGKDTVRPIATAGEPG